MILVTTFHSSPIFQWLWATHAVIIVCILSLIILDLHLPLTDQSGRRTWTMRDILSPWVWRALREETGDSKAIYHHIMITAISDNIFALLLIRAQGKHHLRCDHGLRSVRARNYSISQIDFNADKSPIYWSSIHVLFLGNGIGGIWGKDAGRGLDNG